ncbi:MAG TPA: PEP-CTERM-box response regulator transcription factor [Verrucomicrobiae bacterium]|nr:PEP-CTERM-box response regulator transcription factor [Verrucomicrobiae bacterium]
MKPKLLIVDDDEDIRSQMRWAMGEEYEVVLAEDRLSALENFRTHRPPVALLDLGLPPHPGNPQEGMATLAAMLGLDSAAKVIIVSGQGERANALQAIGAGAYDFLNKPVEMDILKTLVKRAFTVADLEREYRKTASKTENEEIFEGMIGSSPAMRDVFNYIRKAAPSDAPVLILGESGTGKEMAALAIHRRSPKKDGPFVAINCGAIPETLLESELFGHEKGAFTGAHAQRVGRVESAAGGTLFLDEMGELPLSLQVKLLRFLQEKTIERVGGRKEIAVDARIVAATNVDLHKAVAANKFREDLYYRLAVITIKLPPFRARENDIRLLAQSFLKRFAQQSNKGNIAFEPEAFKAMERHQWPGNVRELENRVKRAVIMADGNRISARDLELADVATTSSAANLREARETLEREMVQSALRKHGGKITSAAVELGVSRPTLYELMDKLGIVRDKTSNP